MNLYLPLDTFQEVKIITENNIIECERNSDFINISTFLKENEAFIIACNEQLIIFATIEKLKKLKKELKIEKVKIGLETFKTEDGFLKLLHETHVLFGNDKKFVVYIELINPVDTCPIIIEIKKNSEKCYFSLANIPPGEENNNYLIKYAEHIILDFSQLEEATYDIEIKFIDGKIIGKTTFKYQPLKKRLEKYLPYNPV
ncbi:hypothetical protein Calkro_2350 [Caldicellulosiruptor kronotskyensis 2002]|uniref:Uncharacterized protein n=1 Tax=Caldicellulosiruptor kronotskyensis (strain DSM 18902 / VKM B-2412 / 2002) TaxID=632348 RepID=E4SHE8_CALK2|nr:hypothetical protein [Caldicellulosiruptor kronotskyensis]ADQ47173.1 hypothetical protein Calkro_2350 [Caldicellulosiruptor kronotskyensis 2002]